MRNLLRKYLEWITLVVIVLSIPFVWELWRKPLKVYEVKEDVTVIREKNCRQAMLLGTAACGTWSLLLLARKVVKGQVRRRALRWMPWVLAAFILSTVVRVVMAIQTYPWFFD